MPNPPETEKAPNPWSVIDDFSKNVVTVSSALLGLTVVFATQLIGKVSGTAQYVLFAAWGLAVLAIALGVAAHGLVARFLTTGEPRSQAYGALCANSAFVGLIASATAFAVFGGMTIKGRPTVDAAVIARKAVEDMPALSGKTNSMWRVQSLTFDQATQCYDLTMIDDELKDIYALTVSGEGRISKAEKK